METKLSVDDIFDKVKLDLEGGGGFAKRVKRHGVSETVKTMVGSAALSTYPFVVKERNAATALLYRKIPLPWYVTIQCFVD